MDSSVQAILIAAGKSERMKKNKLFLKLLDKPVIYYSIKPFELQANIKEIVLVTRPENRKKLESLIQKYNFKKIKKITEGGKTRQDSVYEGLKTLDKVSEVLIHNAANPLVTKKEIADVLKATKKYGAAAIGYPAKDTIKRTNSKNFVTETLARKKLWQMQTPQGMKYDIAVHAFEQAYKDGFTGTDDVSLAERIGYKVKLIEGSRENIKITYPEDLKLAELILKARNET
ncbi:MAG: 2-C-methyl-D-erythritol 4-phosphate cytidylyltransferase [Nanoarchaeota archaeon]|nr:2-C-methyl-D-erythritol 4-phosphate cytidylyltransferase [Nanoarchaeota archaeon]MCG2718567.1 2-C-methyl-D-erythritol 4-phosphate cytidylyltransferase [Nanoarchaeota archaeon]